MHIVSFSVSNYRSITKANKLPINDFTVLIGPNNEGKSNVLRAFVLSLEILRDFVNIKGRLGYRIKRPYRHINRDSKSYDWVRDYPVTLQSKKGNSSFVLEFQFDEDELKEFRERIHTSLTENLPIQITIGPDSKPNFKVKIRGLASKSLSKKAELIAQFIGEKLDFEYIPAVRTSESAIAIVEDMVARELMTIEDDPIYVAALKEVEKVQKPVLDRLSGNIKDTLKVFLPNVKNVDVSISKERRYGLYRRACEISIDDGVMTKLEYKGDGVQSLTALSLMRQMSEKGAGGKQLILAVEEPESHLHPRAIHRLKTVLQEMSKKHQVLISTHCPLFVERGNIEANIIVSGKKASPAKKISHIREILGVKQADNLSNAEIVLVVEGESDRIALAALLSLNSDIKKVIDEATLVIESLVGSGNLCYKLTQLRSSICSYHCFLDNDEAGNSAIKKALDEGLLVEREYTLATRRGMAETELEDLYDLELYKELLNKEYGIILNDKNFIKDKSKWSSKIERVFESQGKRWSKEIERRVKLEIAEKVKENPSPAILTAHENSYHSLINAILERVKPKQ